MSCIGKVLVVILVGVIVEIVNGVFSVKGFKGILMLNLCDEIVYIVEDGCILVCLVNDSKLVWVFWGMQCMFVNNFMIGVIEGYIKVFEIIGVGYCVNVQGKNLKLQFGYSYDVDFVIFEGIEIKILDNIMVEISGIDKQKVGQVVVEICCWCKFEFYKGKGIKYCGEYIFCKEGKKK